MITKTETRWQRQKDNVKKAVPNKHVTWKEKRSTSRQNNMKTFVIIVGIVVGVLLLTETVLKKVLINISDKIVDIIEALRKKY